MKAHPAQPRRQQVTEHDSDGTKTEPSRGAKRGAGHAQRAVAVGEVVQADRLSQRATKGLGKGRSSPRPPWGLADAQSRIAGLRGPDAQPAYDVARYSGIDPDETAFRKAEALSPGELIQPGMFEGPLPRTMEIDEKPSDAPDSTGPWVIAGDRFLTQGHASADLQGLASQSELTICWHVNGTGLSDDNVDQTVMGIVSLMERLADAYPNAGTPPPMTVVHGPRLATQAIAVLVAHDIIVRVEERIGNGEPRDSEQLAERLRAELTEDDAAWAESTLSALQRDASHDLAARRRTPAQPGPYRDERKPRAADYAWLND